MAFEFDWTQGRAFVQEGTIFYSPNCQQTVSIPSHPSSTSPFTNNELDASLFKQPTWWTDVYGWQSFIPLTPTYTSSPFEPFCWMPRIVEVDVLIDPRSTTGARETRYQMHVDDCYMWSSREALLIEAAEKIRIWFKIPGNLPPPPSKFNYGRAHKSRRIARKMITLARDWFAIWMGLVSYLIASTKRFTPSISPLYTRPATDSPFPLWYHRLQEAHNFSAAWLDGLISSTVCSYDEKTPRAGVVFQWSRPDVTRPRMEWFLDHKIPMWFVWTKEEEQAFSRDRSLEFLKPPNFIIQDALTILFSNPTSNIPLAGLIIQRYYDLGSDPMTNETVKLLNYREAPSFVLSFTTQNFLDQEACLAKLDTKIEASLTTLLKAKQHEHHASSLADATLHTQTMLEGFEVKGKLYNHWRDFLAIRERRQIEIIAVETMKEKQKRLSREQKPGVNNADMYSWEKIRSSGGKEVYMRLRVNKRNNEHVFASFRKHHRIYNSITNEWDLCREFGHDQVDNDHSTLCSNLCSDSEQSEDEGNFTSDYEYFAEDSVLSDSATRSPSVRTTPEHELTQSSHFPNEDSQMHTAELDLSTSADIENMPVQKQEPDPNEILHYSQNVVETLTYGFGYVPSMPGSSTQPIAEKGWQTILVTLGFVSPFTFHDVEDYEKQAIAEFFNQMVKKLSLPESLDDLCSNNHTSLRHLFDFEAIHRPSPDLFVFSAPRSLASDWLLGVHSPEIALYVCRYILSNPGAHTVVTVASRLLQRGIPFRTLVGLKSSFRHTTIIAPYNPPSYRLSNHEFSVQDFDAYMLRCQSILSQPQGRAALLQGGIIWRIAKEFLSGDGVLSGPSVEATLHRVGYMQNSGTSGTLYCDDELTENEIALICGTYSLYTALGQITVKSWFPPPVCWNKERTACQFIEWTARNEQFFRDLMANIRAGNSKPMSVSEWTSRLRGFKTARIIRDVNRERARAFMNLYVPVQEPTEF